jgi:S1-C subfamily serine protease
MPAEDIGLEVGDIVKQFDNVIIMDGRHLIDVIKRKHAGDVCPIVIKRGEETFNYEILLR